MTTGGGTTGSSSAPPQTEPSETTTSDGSTIASASSSTGEPPELQEFEGVFRYDPRAFKNPIAFQTCDGEWARIDLWSQPAIPLAPRCGGMYVRVLGSLQPGLALGGDDLVVHAIVEWRACQPLDCGGDACEPVRCLSQCSPFDQDCGENEKCVPFPTDGGIAAASACVPVARDTNELGEACNRDPVALAVDTCGAGAVCMGGFGRRTGVCVELCEGSDNNPVCGDGLRCVLSSNGAPYCLPTCEAEGSDCDGVCTASPFDTVKSCVPEPGLPELLEACGERGCEDGFTCSLAGPTEGLCIPLR